MILVSIILLIIAVLCAFVAATDDRLIVCIVFAGFSMLSWGLTISLIAEML